MPLMPPFRGIQNLLLFLAFALSLAGCASRTTTTAITPPSAHPVAETIPVLRQADVFGAVVPSGQAMEAVAEPIAPGLDFVAMINLRPGQRSLTAADLPALQLDRNDLLSLASANMAAGLRPLSEVAPVISAGKIGEIQGDMQEASRLALHADWSALSAALNGNLIVAIPATDKILYSDGNEPTSALTMQARARAIMTQAPNRISEAIYRWTSGGWQLVLLPSK